MGNASNGNAYVPGNGAGGGVAIGAGGATQTSGTVVFANSNGVTFGNNNGTITATVTPGAAAGIAAIQLPNTTYTSGTANFINSNGLSFGSTTGGGITGSYTVPGATVFSNSNGVTFGLNGSTVTASVAAQTSSSLSFSNANGVSFGIAGSTLTASVAAGGVPNISAGTTSGNLGSLVFSNSNGVSFGLNGSTITATVQPGAAAGLAAVSAGTQQQTSGTLAFANSNGITFGMSNSSQITASYTVPGATVFSNSNGVTFGLAGSTVTASYNSTSAAGQGTTFAGTNISASMTLNTAGLNLALSGGAGGGVNSATVLALGNTTGQSSSNTIPLSAFNISAVGIISAGLSGNTLVISSPGTTNFGNLSVSAGTTSGSLGSIVFSNSNGVSFGLNGSTITASAAGGGGGVAIAASNSTFTSGTVVLSVGGGALTISNGAQSAIFSVPATSSISGTGQISISVNGSTISIGVPAAATNTDFYYPYEDLPLAPAQFGNGSVLFDPQPFPNLQFDRVLFPIFNTNSAISSGSHSLSFYFGLYSRNAATLSLIGSTSLSTAVTHSGTLGSYSLYSGMRAFTVGSTATISSGNYWMAFGSRTSSAGADGSYSNMALNGGFFTDSLLSGTLSYGGFFGSAVNNSNQLPLGQGFYSTTTLGMPASVAFSQISGTASNAGNMQAVVFASSTV